MVHSVKGSCLVHVAGPLKYFSYKDSLHLFCEEQNVLSQKEKKNIMNSKMYFQ